MPLSTRGCDPEPRWRARLGLHVSLVFLTTAAWAVTLRQVQIMFMPMGISAPAVIVSDDMDEMPTLGEMPLATMPEAAQLVARAGAFVAIWTVMMAAMMLPAAAPVLLIFATTQAGRGRANIVPTWICAAGYLLVWAAVGLADEYCTKRACDGGYFEANPHPNLYFTPDDCRNDPLTNTWRRVC